MSPMFYRIKLEIMPYYYHYPIGFCNFQDSSHFKKHLFHTIKPVYAAKASLGLLDQGPFPWRAQQAPPGLCKVFTWSHLTSFHLLSHTHAKGPCHCHSGSDPSTKQPCPLNGLFFRRRRVFLSECSPSQDSTGLQPSHSQAPEEHAQSHKWPSTWDVAQ